MTYAAILARVEAATGYAPRRSGDGHIGRCPGHGDTTPSLTLSEGDDGRTLVCCQRGCDFGAIAGALGLQPADFFDRERDEAPPAWDPRRDGHVVAARYRYTDAAGTLLFEKLRKEPKPGHPALGQAKTFTVRRPDPEQPGQWLYDLKGVERPLYRLPDVLAAVEAGRRVFVVEGEKDADRLASLGFCATCNDGGGGKWAPRHTPALAGARVAVIPDNDAAGRAHARTVCDAVSDTAAEVRLVALDTLPGGRPMPVKGDVSDWFDAGGTADALGEIVRATPLSDGSRPTARTADGHTVPTHAGATALPARVYNLLPDTIQTACAHFEAWHERDVFLTALLGALSAALPGVRFQYGRTPRYLSPHLYFFLLANGAGGKGVADFAFSWLDAVDEHLECESADERAAWERRRDLYDRAKKGRAADVDAEPPGPEPALRYVVGGDDTTLGGLYDGLHANADGIAVLSTEADALSGSNRREFGGFSYLLRKAFHHERASESRRGTGRRTVKRPRLAVVVTGTPDQFGRLLDSVEDGLFSRFAVYAFDPPGGFESQRPDAAARDVAAFTEARARDVARLWGMLRTRSGGGVEAPLYFDVPPDLWGRVDAAFSALDRALFSRPGVSPYLAATVKRGAVVAFRIASVLGVWRAFDAGIDLSRAARVEATPDDMDAAILLATTYAEHALAQAAAQGGRRAAEAHAGGADRMTGADRTFLDALPAAFGRAEMAEAAGRAGFSEATAYRRVGEWVDAGLIRKEGQGAYTKRTAGNRANPANPEKTAPPVLESQGAFSQGSQDSQGSHFYAGDGAVGTPADPWLTEDPF